MNKELLIRKCKHCGAMAKVLQDCNCGDCGIKCCGEQMEALVPNSVDASFEKHVPNYEIKDGKMYITVNHVMEENHYIEWISVVNGNTVATTYFKPGEEAKTVCDYIPGSEIYAYCNKHELWKKDVE